MPDGQTSAQLATFDRPLAEAVATVLDGEGIPTTVESRDDREVEVWVPADRRDEALVLLANRMEQIHELVARAGTVTATPVPPIGQLASGEYDQDDETEPPIVMERLRRMSLGLVVLLAPLLVITLAGVNMPIGYALALFIAGLVAVVYWRSRSES